MTKDEEKGYLFYIYRVDIGYNYKPVDPKYYSEEGLKKFASEYAKDGILYKTEKECQEIIADLNKDLHATIDFTSVKGSPSLIDGGYVTITFPSGKITKVDIDPVYETVFIQEDDGRRH